MTPLVTIGLEVHCQLNTKTKIFCGCAVLFGAEPNTNVCPVCLGLPGALPVLNHKAFLLGLRAVLATGGTPSGRIKFDRKNYFYPDLPKGYQISQFDAPLGSGGTIEVEAAGKVKNVRLNRIHLEEDAGKSMHDQSADSSFVDLNRAGTPLIEIVTEPDLESPEEAYDYLTHLKSILKAIGVSECDMEKGQLRCDANVSVRKNASDPLGKRVEIKNLNSFKAVKASLEHEIVRQAAALEKSETVVQETRLWDDAKAKTFPMRSKEEAHDYRYFPEPDLVPFHVSVTEIELGRAELPELPKAKRERLMKQYGLSDYDSRLIGDDLLVADFYEKAVAEAGDAKAVANWITGPVFAYLGANTVSLDATRLTPALLVSLDRLVSEGQLSLQAAKEKVFPVVIAEGREPREVLEEKGLKQVSDDASLKAWIREAIDANPKVVGDFKSGKETAAMFLVGQVMKKSQGKANPGKVRELLLKTLNES